VNLGHRRSPRAAGLRRSLFRTFGAVICAFSVAGAVGVGSLKVQERSTDRVLRVEAPVLVADRTALQAMTDAETGVRGFLLTRDPRFLDPYTSGSRSFTSAIDRAIELAGAMDDSGRTQTLLRAEKLAAESWLTSWAEPAVASAAVSAAEQEQGKALFDAYRATHRTVAEGLNASITHDRDLIHDRALWLLVLTCGSLVLVLGIAAYGARRTVRRVTGPIDALQETLSDLTHGDLSARVEPRGPRELVALGQAVNNLADEVDRRSGAFVSTVSHELRTPLTSILGYLELMQDGSVGPIPPEQQDVLDAVQRNSTRLLELVEDLLTVSRLEGSALLLANEPVDLRTIVSSAVSGVGLTGRSLTLSWDAPNAEVTILGDAAQLRRVVSQLLANAVTFTPDGGRIDVNVTSDGRSAELTVSDTGIGIEYEEQRHIFHRFYRPAATERLAAPGSGLGLAISRGVVHQHGGAIRLHSQPGVGTTVTITLPLARWVETESTVASCAAAPGAVPDVAPEGPEPPAYEEILAGSSRKRGMR
jgi:signal transduction histidine kinase